MGVPGRDHRRPPVLPGHELERGPRPLVGAVRRLAGRPGHLGRDRAGHGRRPLALRRAGADIPRFLDAAAPALLVAQAIGRVGNYFNQELFGRPTSLPWGLEIDPDHRPAGYLDSATFHPTFLYEIVWNLAAGRRPGVARPPPAHPAARPVRALRRRLLGLPHLRGAAARRPGPPRPRPAPELLRRRRPRRRRPDVVRAHAAPRRRQSPP